MAKSVAERFNLKLIDLRIAQMDPADLNGLPDLAGRRATFKSFDLFPLEDDELPLKTKGENGEPDTYYDGWLLFLDEMSSADEGRQAAAYKLVLDRMVGNNKLHKNVRVMAAGNLETDSAIVNTMSSALVSRFAHMGVQCDLNQWLNKIAYPRGYDSRLTAFLEFKASCFYTFDPANPTQAYACPRTWEDADKYIKVLSAFTKRGEELKSIVTRNAMGGVIGHGPANEFHSFLMYQSDLPTQQQVLNNPEGFPLNQNNIGVMFALTGMLSDMINEQNVDTVMKAIERLSPDFKIVTLRAAIKRRGMDFMSLPTIAKWAKDNAHLIR